MNSQSLRTVVYAAVGVVSILLAVLVHYATRPAEMGEFESVGQPFYPDFNEPGAAKSLEVAVFDEDAGQVRRFEVAYQDGRWRIPSHHGYPVEATQRLASAAASMMGITREALAGRSAGQHDRFGVVDPTSDKAKDSENTGTRITLRDEDDEVLADYIIGDEVPQDEAVDELTSRMQGREPTGPMYYVRLPGETETFKSSVEIDVSTKFADWIEPDLLKIAADDVKELKVYDYSLERREQVFVMGGRAVTLPVYVPTGEEQIYELTRTKQQVPSRFGMQSFDQWNLDGLNPNHETLKTDKLNDLVSQLDDLTIAGVRPRLKVDGQPLLTADLNFDFPEEVRQDPRRARELFSRLERELLDYGFQLGRQSEASDDLRLYSAKGQLSVGSTDGVLYHLHFGEIFSGDEKEIEIGGFAKNKAKNQGEKKGGDETAEDDKAKDGSADSSAEKTDEKKDDGQKSRFLLVRVNFDESLIPGRPTQPIKPVKPEKPKIEKDDAAKPDEGDRPNPPIPEEAASAEDAEGDQDSNKNDGDEDGSADDDTSGDEKKEEKPNPEEEYKAAMKRYEEALVSYQQDLKRYNDEMKEFEKKIEAGKRKVQELNERFGQWYYVVSAENLEDMQLSRSDLVEKKEPPEEDKPPMTGDSTDDPPDDDLPRSEVPLRLPPPLPEDDEELPPGKEDDGKKPSEDDEKPSEDGAENKK